MFFSSASLSTSGPYATPPTRQVIYIAKSAGVDRFCLGYVPISIFGYSCQMMVTLQQDAAETYMASTVTFPPTLSISSSHPASSLSGFRLDNTTYRPACLTIHAAIERPMDCESPTRRYVLSLTNSVPASTRLTRTGTLASACQSTIASRASCASAGLVTGQEAVVSTSKAGLDMDSETSCSWLASRASE
ncbi:hypothetical protein BDP81DRAFT_188104 [Colletotrichum phormii]|uniref:Uncharacterized protein n=1 Tax=Colletotrichum phormii TaxID=359342 RepID=A0AAI9ZBB9_9PEZI|nr:uncharacterized protein BDP81DRAFT_188104 [Colletotrichum phormii]KAK1613500.1 hypothetical protein BDP81DRAFT_188104 [Colletotrichum phormii]